MLLIEKIESLEDFKRLKKDDLVVVEWKRDMYCGDKEVRLGFYYVVSNKERTTEIILQSKHNVYFNYSMFLNPQEHGVSNCKSIIKIKQS